MNKNEMNSKPRRAQGGMGLLSRSISIQNPQVSIPLIPREEREKEKRDREGMPQRGDGVLLRSGKRERKRGRG